MTRATWALNLSCILLSCGGDSSSSTDGGHDAPQVLAENTAAMCGDGEDNDDDGFTDCADQDCWPLTSCAEARPDGWQPPTDGGLHDGFHDAPYQGDGTVTFDTGLQSCTIHWDCPQGAFCYRGKCLRDVEQAIYHCGKPGCPPGHWCLDQANAKQRCAEDPGYACQDACDCGPAHCCKNVPSLGGKRCVKDQTDHWLTQGGLLDPTVQCELGADATYCCTHPECHAGRHAFGVQAQSFRCHDRSANPGVSAQATCGVASCFGTACNCEAARSCVDTMGQAVPAGKACGQLAGGTCVSNAIAEAVFGWQPSDILPCCATGCTAPGKPCDAGWRSGGIWAFARVEGLCGSCGDGACEVWESPQTCAADCSCGDGVCAISEAVIDPLTGATACTDDCGSCGDGACDALETATTCPTDCGAGAPGAVCGDQLCAPEHGETFARCPADCASPCADAATQPAVYRFCGDGLCGDGVRVATTCDWGESETCLTCPQDCDACEWRRIRGGVAGLSNHLEAVWGTSASNIFAVGDDGTILHFDGASWQPMASGTPVYLTQVWGSGSSDAYITGMQGTILRFNGASWQPMASGTAHDLRGVWGSSATNVFVVGDGGTILRSDGASWQPMASGITEQLRCVWGSSATSVLAVGDGGTILRFDGASWQPMASGTAQNLRGVWGSSATNAFAVGDQGTLSRFDGTSWQLVATEATAALYDVWGSSATNVFAVGDLDTALHFDGVRWQPIPSGAGAYLWGVWGSSATDVVAVGDRGVLRFDGNTWQRVVHGDAAEYLRGVWASSASEAFAVGYPGAILRFDGTSWLPIASGTTEDLLDVWGSSSSDVFTAGNLGAILHFAGTSWQPMASGTPHHLGALWGSSASDVYAGGAEGVRHYDGAGWQHSPVPASYVSAIWGASASEVFAVSIATRTVWRFDGALWSERNEALSSMMTNGLWGSSSSDVFAVGEDGLIDRFDGASWQPMSSGTPQRLLGVAGTSASNVVAVGKRGTILRFDGTSWRFARADLRAATTPICPSLEDIDIAPDGTGFIVGEHGLIFEGCSSGHCPKGPDGGVSPLDAGAAPDTAPAAACPNAICDLGESCDGRNATLACPQDCPSGDLGHPQKEYCFVNGVCVGPGCP